MAPPGRHLNGYTGHAWNMRVSFATRPSEGPWGIQDHGNPVGDGTVVEKAFAASGLGLVVAGRFVRVSNRGAMNVPTLNNAAESLRIVTFGWTANTEGRSKWSPVMANS